MLNFHYHLCVCVPVCTQVIAPSVLEVRGPLLKLVLSPDSVGPEDGDYQAWWLEPPPAEPSHQPLFQLSLRAPSILSHG